MTIKSPYPYFGGKSTVASEIWRRLGGCPNYIEPFFGSGAVLLARPHSPDLELVNDIDGYIVNFWRAVQADAETVAAHADYPAFENDLHARHAWLVQRKDSLRDALEGDPDYYDAKIAGWWVWGMSLWIGSGFCSGRGSWVVEDGKLVNGKDASGVAGQLPKVFDRNLRAKYVTEAAQTGEAIVRQSPRLTAWQGVNSADTAIAGQLPYLSRPRKGVLDNAGAVVRQLPRQGALVGVHRKMPETVSARGDASSRASEGGIYAYFAALQARFRRVRVTCGDWSRVVTPAVLGAKSPCAVLLDPPYAADGREDNLYTTDDTRVHADARAWAIANGDNPNLRIAYCGYDEHDTFPENWTALRWKANGGYSNQGEARKANASREVIWFSPHCVPVERQLSLFASAEG